VPYVLLRVLALSFSGLISGNVTPLWYSVAALWFDRMLLSPDPDVPYKTACSRCTCCHEGKGWLVGYERVMCLQHRACWFALRDPLWGLFSHKLHPQV
jgi:hypothetical protein